MGTEKKYIDKIIKTHDELVTGVKRIADKLNKKFSNQEVVLITVLKGGLPFSLELMKHLTFDISIDFIVSSSYHLDKKKSSIQTKYEATIDIKKKHVLVADDLVDSGETMIKLTKILEAYNPKSITISGIYGKPTRTKSEYDEFYVWEEDPGGFLLGFGLDYNEKFRNLPYIAIIKQDK